MHERYRRFFRLLAVSAVTSWAAAGCTEQVETSTETTLSSMTYAAVAGDDAPELAHPGAYRVGVRTLRFVFDDAPDVSIAGHLASADTRWRRELSVDVLYPADVAPDTPADAVYEGNYQTGFAEIDGLPDRFEIRGYAVRDAPVLANTSFPLVLVSHGLFNTPGVLSGLTENLASKGYVVAAIDHRDAEDDPATPVHLFARVLLNRALDQKRVLGELLTLAPGDAGGVRDAIDAERVALIGFSMGGYGVLAHAGAGFDPDGSAFTIVPAHTIADQTASSPVYRNEDRSHIDAVIAFAPWGGKAGEVWTDEALTGVTAPLLVFAGSEDDVSDYEHGIRRIFEQANGAERFMLVFQNAQHNLVQVKAPPAAHLDVRSWMTFEDATWRRERLLNTGVHFATAFLDWHLKGHSDARRFFDVPTVQSNDAT